MKKVKRFVGIAVSVLCILIFTGCSESSSRNQEKGSITASEEKSETKPKNSEKSKTGKLDNKKTEQKKTREEKTKETSKEELMECDWTLKVDQTIPVTTDGMTVNYTLVLIAQKEGGKDVQGNYKGAAYVEIKLDTSNLSNELVSFSGGFNVNASSNNLEFNLVPYNIDEYSNYGLGKDEIGLAPLVKYETMALISPTMQGTGILNPSVKTIDGSHGEYKDGGTGNFPLPMKITVLGGQVRVEVPSLKLGKSFEGMLLGTPINSAESKKADKNYEEMMKKIDELEVHLEKGK